MQTALGEFNEAVLHREEIMNKKKKYFINVALKMDKCSLASLITFIHFVCSERISFPPRR